MLLEKSTGAFWKAFSLPSDLLRLLLIKVSAEKQTQLPPDAC